MSGSLRIKVSNVSCWGRTRNGRVTRVGGCTGYGHSGWVWWHGVSSNAWVRSGKLECQCMVLCVSQPGSVFKLWSFGVGQSQGGLTGRASGPPPGSISVLVIPVRARPPRGTVFTEEPSEEGRRSATRTDGDGRRAALTATIVAQIASTGDCICDVTALNL